MSILLYYVCLMKIVLATGIYPPDIGGPATYVRELGKALKERGVNVTVITYGEEPTDDVIRISRRGGPIKRWRKYAKALREHGADADIIYCFSSISCGVPLWLAKLKHPRKVLRLGGDFFWERSTDRGGTMSLREWYESRPWIQGMMSGVLKHFDHIVFSTHFQQELYEKSYAALPLHSVIENALPQGIPVHHTAHNPFKLLFLGRFVPFKNLGSLILAMVDLPTMTLSLVGEGPLEKQLDALIFDHRLRDRVQILPSVSGDMKQQVFLDHDLLVLPSYTELSPNTALEARAAGLPVLLTSETGLSRLLTDAAQLSPLRSPAEIATAIQNVASSYETLADRASSQLPLRTWDHIAQEHVELFRSLL